MPESAIPFVKLNQDIRAKNKINLFQVQGNHMNYAKSVKRGSGGPACRLARCMETWKASRTGGTPCQGDPIWTFTSI